MAQQNRYKEKNHNATDKNIYDYAELNKVKHQTK